MTTILFTNWTNDKFEHTWDKELFIFEPGQTIYLQGFLANHFAKHLANRELMKQKDLKYHMAVNNFENPLFKDYFNKAISQVSQSESTIKSEIEEINKNAELEPEKKAKRGRKAKVEEEEVFEGLTNE